MHLPERLGLNGLCTPISGLSYPIPELFLLLFLIYQENGYTVREGGHPWRHSRLALWISCAGYSLDVDSTTNTLTFNRPQPG